MVEAIRLPRSLTALLAGAALGIAGLQMQTLFRNPLADPFALGISSGASLGVAIVVLGSGMSAAAAFGASTGLRGDALLIGAAIVGALAVLALVLVVSSRVANPTTVLDSRSDVRLCGVGDRDRAGRRQLAGASDAVGAVGIRIVLGRDLAAAATLRAAHDRRRVASPRR